MRADLLHVIAVISNPVRFKSRYKLYKDFEKHMLASGVKLYTVEVQQGDRPFIVTDSNNPSHIQMRTVDVLWIKENMINIAISRLPADWQYVAWVDADVAFLREDWAAETVQMLQIYEVVQMFETCVDLGPNGQALQLHQSFMSQYLKNGCNSPVGPGQYGSYTPKKNFWHPGFAWAATKNAITKLGGLFDGAILGSGDHHMAMALIGHVRRSVPGNISKKYLNELDIYQARADRHIKGEVGYVSGTIVHNWHGKKKDRRYVERWEILRKYNFDPDDDLKRDWQGLYQMEDITPRQQKMIADFKAYFWSRLEDSIDLE